MNRLIKIVLGLTVFSSLFGPSVNFPLNEASINIYISDIFVVILSFLLLLNIKSIGLQIKENKSVKVLFIFIGYCLISLIFSPISLSINEAVVSFLYILRFVMYFSVYLLTVLVVGENKKSENSLIKYLNITGIGFLVISWLQYFFYPDLRNLSYLGWDPHYKRIFGLIFDPNYLGLILTFYFLFRLHKNKPNLSEYLIRGICLLTIAFTYSRSTFLALFFGGLFYAYKKQKLSKYAGLSILLVSLLFFLPRPGGAGVRLERLFSIQERILNWQYASQIISKSPVSGVGFNTLRFAKKNYKELPDDWLTSHSAAGIDNSFLFVAATTGIIGLTIYLYFLFIMFKSLGVLGQSVILAAAVHSLFLNSLFFNFILIWVWFLSGLDKNKTKENN